MHRIILNAPKGMLTDHKDGIHKQPKYNLRLCNASQNSCNRISRSKFGYLGVTFHKWSGKYFAAVRVNGIRFYSK